MKAAVKNASDYSDVDVSTSSAVKSGLGVCDIENKSLYLWIFSITIIRRYFAECVIVLISEYRAQLQFMIFFILIFSFEFNLDFYIIKHFCF